MPRECQILNLPAELRDQIYRHVLVKHTSMSDFNKSMLEEPSLLYACRQIRYEGLPVYYGENVFLIKTHEDRPSPEKYHPGIDQLVSWWAHLTPTKRNLVKAITILFGMSRRESWEMLEASQFQASIGPHDQAAMDLINAAACDARQDMTAIANAGLNLDIIEIVGPREVFDGLDVAQKMYKDAAEFACVELTGLLGSNTAPSGSSMPSTQG